MRSASREAFSVSGETLSSAMRMRSIAEIAMTGSVSHTPDAMSHSFGPREPNSVMKAANDVAKDCTPALVDDVSAGTTFAAPLSNSAVSVGELRIWRDISHMA